MDQEELQSIKTEFIKEDSENMSDPEPCRMKHTEDTEELSGWCLFFIHSAVKIYHVTIQTFDNMYRA